MENTTKPITGKVDLYLGVQWGDEGKGKEIDEALSREELIEAVIYDAVCRFQGGPNAGHTYEFEGVTIIGHLMPSGCLHKYVDLIIGNGVVLNPVSFNKEYYDLKSKGIDVIKRLFISERAKLITYLHPFLDAAEECRMGKNCVGSTMSGIGPTYRDFKARQVPLLGDILRPNFMDQLADFIRFQMNVLKMYEESYGYVIPHDKIEEKRFEWFEALEMMFNYNICDTSELIRKKLEQGKRVLAEGAQGAMLDNDFGDYPYVTSSNTLTANLCLGLGVPHHAIGEVNGVIKAYVTKVGGGSFPSKIKDKEVEEAYREAGHEYGATTGRPRMCGWLDMVALKRAIYLTGTTGIFINKTDICPVDTVKVVIGYLDKDGNKFENFPLHLEDVYDVETIEFPGWGTGAVEVTEKSKLPQALINYVEYIEEELSPLGAKIKLLGTGPKRGQSVVW